MTDPIQAAREKADKTVSEYGDAVETWAKSRRTQADIETLLKNRHLVQAAIARLAALVREYGHGQNCDCHDAEGCVFENCRKHPFHDSCCLPESREEKP